MARGRAGRADESQRVAYFYWMIREIGRSNRWNKQCPREVEWADACARQMTTTGMSCVEKRRGRPSVEEEFWRREISTSAKLNLYR